MISASITNAQKNYIVSQIGNCAHISEKNRTIETLMIEPVDFKKYGEYTLVLFNVSNATEVEILAIFDKKYRYKGAYIY